MPSLDQTLSNLLDWMHTWKQGSGMFGGYVVHAIHGVANFEYTGPQPFQYFGIIEGFLRLHEKTRKQRYLEWAQEAARYLAFELLDESGCFKYSSFEYNPKEWKRDKGFTLVYNAFADIALLKLANFMKKQRTQYYKVYVIAARRNIDWLIAKLWKGQYLTGCLNQDMAAVIAFIGYYKVTGDPYYINKFGFKIAEWICNFKTKLGGFRRGINNLSYVSPWYDSILLMGFLELYNITNNTKWLFLANEIGNFILFSVDSSTGGLYHSWQESDGSWKAMSHVLLTAPIGYVIYALRKLSDTSKRQYPYENLLEWILSNQKLNGAFPNSEGFDDWRDRSTVVAWNHLMFLCLSDLLPSRLEELPSSQRVDVSIDLVGNDIVIEDNEKVSIHQDGSITKTLWKTRQKVRNSENIYPVISRGKNGTVELSIGSNYLSNKKVSIETYMDNRRIKFRGNAENVTFYLKLKGMVKEVFLNGKVITEYRLIKNFAKHYIMELKVPKWSNEIELSVTTESQPSSEHDLKEKIKGIVTDVKGKPLRTRLELVSEFYVKYTTETHDDGSFTIVAAPGNYLLICRSFGYRPVIMPIRLPKKNIVIRLQKEGVGGSLRYLFSRLMSGLILYAVKHRINPLIGILASIRRLMAETKFKPRHWTPA